MRLTAGPAIALALGVLAAPVAACVLADPPATIPPATLLPPEVDHDLVQPPATDLLSSWPPEFVIPVLVLDPSYPVLWHAFIDYDPISGSQFVAQGQVDPDQAGDDAGTRVIYAHVPPPADLTACHTVEVLVALGFDSNHTPDSVGGDSVTWFYSPSGSLEGCSFYDAGSLADAGDGGDGGDGGGT